MLIYKFSVLGSYLMLLIYGHLLWKYKFNKFNE